MRTTASKLSTYIGLGIALFGISASGRLLDRVFGPSETVGLATAKQLTCFAVLGLLIWIVTRKERLPLASIGWRTDALWRSLLWGVLGFVLCWLAFGLSLLVDALLHLHVVSPTSELPLWVLTLTVLRAGIVEEACYRGYAMERIKSLTGSTALAWAIPLGIFTAFHFYIGWAGMLNALFMGAVLSGLYWWRRDLIANMISHALVDFLPLVLFQWLAR
jgi:uncharacterized protein